MCLFVFFNNSIAASVMGSETAVEREETEAETETHVLTCRIKQSLKRGGSHQQSWRRVRESHQPFLEIQRAGFITVQRELHSLRHAVDSIYNPLHWMDS